MKKRSHPCYGSSHRVIRFTLFLDFFRSPGLFGGHVSYILPTSPACNLPSWLRLDVKKKARQSKPEKQPICMMENGLITASITSKIEIVHQLIQMYQKDFRFMPGSHLIYLKYSVYNQRRRKQGKRQ